MTWLRWNNSSKRDELTYAPIIHLAERFAPLVDQEVIKEEFEDYQLMEKTEIGTEEGGVLKYVDLYWAEIIKIKTAMGQMWFSRTFTSNARCCQFAIQQCLLWGNVFSCSGDAVSKIPCLDLLTVCTTTWTSAVSINLNNLSLHYLLIIIKQIINSWHRWSWSCFDELVVLLTRLWFYSSWTNALFLGDCQVCKHNMLCYMLP